MCDFWTYKHHNLDVYDAVGLMVGVLVFGVQRAAAQARHSCGVGATFTLGVLRLRYGAGGLATRACATVTLSLTLAHEPMSLLPPSRAQSVDHSPSATAVQPARHEDASAHGDRVPSVLASDTPVGLPLANTDDANASVDRADDCLRDPSAVLATGMADAASPQETPLLAAPVSSGADRSGWLPESSAGPHGARSDGLASRHASDPRPAASARMLFDRPDPRPGIGEEMPAWTAAVRPVPFPPPARVAGSPQSDRLLESSVFSPLRSAPHALDHPPGLSQPGAGGVGVSGPTGAGRDAVRGMEGMWSRLDDAVAGVAEQLGPLVEPPSDARLFCCTVDVRSVKDVVLPMATARVHVRCAVEQSERSVVNGRGGGEGIRGRRRNMCSTYTRKGYSHALQPLFPALLQIRYRYPFFGSAAPVHTQAVDVPRRGERLFPDPFCAFEFISTWSDVRHDQGTPMVYLGPSLPWLSCVV